MASLSGASRYRSPGYVQADLRVCSGGIAQSIAEGMIIILRRIAVHPVYRLPVGKMPEFYRRSLATCSDEIF